MNIGNSENPLAEPESFIFRDIEIDDGKREVGFRYAFDNGLTFCETLAFDNVFPPPGTPLRDGFEAALRALFVMAGVSYYKAFAPHRMELPSVGLDAAQRAFFQEAYISGLGEFGYRNQIDVAAHVNFPQAVGEIMAVTPSVPLPRRSAVLMGGGKDSLVSVEVLKAASEPMLLFAVNPRRPMIACAEASGVPLLAVRRKIDPALLALNASGALNGHIPITAIVSLIAAAAAFVYGFDTIVLSNERSADEGNLVVGGRIVNHQYSKTSAFEKLLRGFLAANVSPDIDYFSLLRPLSELQIAANFAKTSTYDAEFTSCNRAFRLEGASSSRWCRNCAKCRFAFLILATAMAPARLESIFGGNLLNDGTQLEGYEEIVGLKGHKPWDCVGETLESQAAMVRLSDDENWSSSAIVRELAQRLRGLRVDWAKVNRDLMTPSDAHFMPERYRRMLDAYIG